ncbi:MAG TPA: FGGY-family carbohydrate kinase, partial [Phnomibacter sp.]|nr:FGGY-family carbohydrate kinase [Phnomibacter sp.]
SWQGTSVKASRLFAGFEHQQQCKRIAAFYGIDEQILYTVAYNDNWPLEAGQPENGKGVSGAYKWAPASAFAERSLSSFVNAEHAYHQLIFDLVITQVASSLLVLQHTAVENLYVDGGFSHNEIYMQMLANALPGYKVYAANVAQATALGAALALHQHWNKSSIPLQLITTTLYNPKEKLPAINC